MFQHVRISENYKCKKSSITIKETRIRTVGKICSSALLHITKTEFKKAISSTSCLFKQKLICLSMSHYDPSCSELISRTLTLRLNQMECQWSKQVTLYVRSFVLIAHFTRIKPFFLNLFFTLNRIHTQTHKHTKTRVKSAPF